MKYLVIVESPAKSKTISKMLGSNYIVKSSFGHIRDLPESKIGVEGIRIVNDTKGVEYPPDATEEELVDCMLKIGHFE